MMDGIHVRPQNLKQSFFQRHPDFVQESLLDSAPTVVGLRSALAASQFEGQHIGRAICLAPDPLDGDRPAIEWHSEWSLDEYV